MGYLLGAASIGLAFLGKAAAVIATAALIAVIALKLAAGCSCPGVHCSGCSR